MRFSLFPLTPVIAQRILTSIPVSIESADYKFPGNSHGCGHITTENLSELTIDMSQNSCGGGKIQCPRCFILHHPLRLSIQSCEAPPRTARCQETGQCPVLDQTGLEHRVSEYLFINYANEPSVVGSDSITFSTLYPFNTEGESDSIAIAPHSAKSGLCYQGRFYWP
jgi:hypothetical protein